MNNAVKSGKIMTYPVPAAGVTGGLGYLIGALFVVATKTVAYAADATFEGVTDGVVNLPKATGEGNLVDGQPLYWDVANARVSIDPTVGLPIGTASTKSSTAAGLTADTTCDVLLSGQSLAGRMHTIRKRFTIAQVNAGATLVPALSGLKVRMVDAMGIAIGGAAGAVTTVDILATLSTGRKLVAFAQASLTQSTVLRAGASGAAVLADGASFAANDAGTAITVGKTGPDVTTATHIDVSFTYTLEA